MVVERDIYLGWFKIYHKQIRAEHFLKSCVFSFSLITCYVMHKIVKCKLKIILFERQHCHLSKCVHLILTAIIIILIWVESQKHSKWNSQQCQLQDANLISLIWDGHCCLNLVSIELLVHRPLSSPDVWLVRRKGWPQNNLAKRTPPLRLGKFSRKFWWGQKGIILMVCPPLVCINALEGAWCPQLQQWLLWSSTNTGGPTLLIDVTGQILPPSPMLNVLHV